MGVDTKWLADRIEQLAAINEALIAERDEAWKRAAHSEEMWGKAEVKLARANDRIQGLKELLWAAEKDANEAEDYAEELEAKLAKAVEVAEKSIKWLRLYGSGVHREAVALKKLTGGKDE